MKRKRKQDETPEPPEKPLLDPDVEIPNELQLTTEEINEGYALLLKAGRERGGAPYPYKADELRILREAAEEFARETASEAARRPVDRRRSRPDGDRSGGA